jgi:hypothetical protein
MRERGTASWKGYSPAVGSVAPAWEGEAASSGTTAIAPAGRVGGGGVEESSSSSRSPLRGLAVWRDSNVWSWSAVSEPSSSEPGSSRARDSPQPARASPELPARCELGGALEFGPFQLGLRLVWARLQRRRRRELQLSCHRRYAVRRARRRWGAWSRAGEEPGMYLWIQSRNLLSLNRNPPLPYFS